MKKSKTTVTTTAAEMAQVLGLSPANGAEIQLRSDLNSKIVAVVRRKGLTHLLCRSSGADLAHPCHRHHERDTKAISTDLLLRVLYALGYTAKIRFQAAA